MGAHTAVPTQTSTLLTFGDLEDAQQTGQLAADELRALHAVADWIRTYVLGPDSRLGRPGPVCPYVQGTLDAQTLWLAPEHAAGRTVADVVALLDGYKRLLLNARPPADARPRDSVIVVVFADLPADRAQALFDGIVAQLGVRSYREDGVLFGPYYEGNGATAVYNSGFRPFESPVPFVFVRTGVAADWKFFLDDDTWIELWAHRHGDAGALALARELRRLPWRENPPD